jgi:hypothetical protein
MKVSIKGVDEWDMLMLTFMEPKNMHPQQVKKI